MTISMTSASGAHYSRHQFTTTPSLLAQASTPLQDRTMLPPMSVIPQSHSRKRRIVTQTSPEATTSTSKSLPLNSALISSPDPDDAEYAPIRAKRKGASGKTSNGRPTSKEALRKANHSLIERRRREKINHALGELRSMVPGLGDTGSGKGGEFKLEVSDERHETEVYTLIGFRCWRGL